MQIVLWDYVTSCCHVVNQIDKVIWNRKINLWTLASCILLYVYIGMSLDSEPFLESSLCVTQGRSPSHSLGRSKASYRKQQQNLRSQPRHLDLKKGLFSKFNEKSTERERELFFEFTWLSMQLVSRFQRQYSLLLWNIAKVKTNKTRCQDGSSKSRKGWPSKRVGGCFPSSHKEWLFTTRLWCNLNGWIDHIRRYTSIIFSLWRSVMCRLAGLKALQKRTAEAKGGSSENGWALAQGHSPSVAHSEDSFSSQGWGQKKGPKLVIYRIFAHVAQKCVRFPSLEKTCVCFKESEGWRVLQPLATWNCQLFNQFLSQAPAGSPKMSPEMEVDAEFLSMPKGVLQISFRGVTVQFLCLRWCKGWSWWLFMSFGVLQFDDSFGIVRYWWRMRGGSFQEAWWFPDWYSTGDCLAHWLELRKTKKQRRKDQRRNIQVWDLGINKVLWRTWGNMCFCNGFSISGTGNLASFRKCWEIALILGVHIL